MNTPSPSLPRLALIAGPTASGKSALALRVAEAVGGTIINADSMQVYRDLSVVTARPTPAEEARAPHMLYGHRDAAHACSAADWAAEARAAIADVHAGQGRPILVGGTGLYLRTLLDGIAPVPPVPAALREEVRALALSVVRDRLTSHDPAAAARLHPNDDLRSRRALEVVLATGRPLADWQTDRRGGIAGQIHLSALILTPDRDWLRQRAATRFAEILDDGQAEVAALMQRALDPALPAMRAIGVPEIAAMQQGALTRQQALTAGTAATHQYVKRQTTWFAHQAPASCARADQQDYDNAAADLVTFLR